VSLRLYVRSSGNLPLSIVLINSAKVTYRQHSFTFFYPNFLNANTKLQRKLQITKVLITNTPWSIKRHSSINLC